MHASGECEIDVARRELRVLGSAMPVGGRAFEVLELLARSAGEVVSKNEQMDHIWPGAIVTENTLHVHTMAIRKALGPYRKLLRTESRRGYRLLGDWMVSRHHAAKPPVGMQRIRIDGESPLTNFPAPVTRLIGRTAAVARLRDLMSAFRIVTLTGPGGIGKTSLALKAARGIVGEFADGGQRRKIRSARRLTSPAGRKHCSGNCAPPLVLRVCVRIKVAAMRQAGLWPRSTTASPRASRHPIYVPPKRFWTSFRDDARAMRSGQVQPQLTHRRYAGISRTTSVNLPELIS